MPLALASFLIVSWALASFLMISRPLDCLPPQRLGRRWGLGSTRQFTLYDSWAARPPSNTKTKLGDVTA